MGENDASEVNKPKAMNLAFEQWFHDKELPSKVKEDCQDAWIAAVLWTDEQWKVRKR